MQRRDVVMGALSVAAAAPSVQAAPPSQVQLAKFRFKPGGRSSWLDWSEELRRRRTEVEATLRNEGVRTEVCFLSSDGDFVFYFLEAADLAKAKATFAASRASIDDGHKAHETASLEFVEVMTPLFAFRNG